MLEDKSPQEVEQEKIEADIRDSKGGIGNSWDWIFGEGNWQKLWQGSADAAQDSIANDQAQQQGAPLSSSDVNPRAAKANVFNPTKLSKSISPIERAKAERTIVAGGLNLGGFKTLVIDPNQSTSFFGGQAKDKPVIKSLLLQQTDPKGATPIVSKNILSRGQERFGSNISTTGDKQSSVKTLEQEKFLTTPQGFRKRSR